MIYGAFPLLIFIALDALAGFIVMYLVLRTKNSNGPIDLRKLFIGTFLWTIMGLVLLYIS